MVSAFRRVERCWDTITTVIVRAKIPLVRGWCQSYTHWKPCPSARPTWIAIKASLSSNHLINSILNSTFRFHIHTYETERVQPHIAPVSAYSELWSATGWVCSTQLTRGGLVEKQDLCWLKTGEMTNRWAWKYIGLEHQWNTSYPGLSNKCSSYCNSEFLSLGKLNPGATNLCFVS
jgi:hypothetical protein